jgi:hypothetical protein
MSYKLQLNGNKSATARKRVAIALVTYPSTAAIYFSNIDVRKIPVEYHLHEYNHLLMASRILLLKTITSVVKTF